MRLNFEPIDISMRSMVERHRAAWDMESSEYTFTNLLIWGAGGHILLAEQGDVLYCLLRYDGEAPFMFAPLSCHKNIDYHEAVSVAEEYMRHEHIEPRFMAVTGHLLDLFREQCPDYELIEDRGNFDYVYSTEDLLYLHGKKFHAKKNHLNQFTSSYDFEYIKIRPDMLDECLSVYRQWLDEKTEIDASALAEMEAIRTLITHMDVLGVKGGGIRIGGKLVAFTLGERIRDDMALIHIEKADGEIPGLFTAINQQFIEHEWSDTRFINREEDMNLEGLRKAKMSYHPVKMVEKYEARPYR